MSLVNEPAAYIKAALESVGLKVTSVDVTDYAPEAFGNIVARVSTDLGDMTIIYDREFLIDAAGPCGLHAALEAQLKRSLEEHKKSSAL